MINNNCNINKIVFCFVMTAAMFAAVLNSCKKDDDNKKPASKSSKYIAVDQKLGDQIDFAILGLDGSGYFYEFRDENLNIPKRISFYDGNKKNLDLIVNFSEDGLPESIIHEDFTFVLGKYEGNKFSAVVIIRDGKSQIFENIETDMSWNDYKNGLYGTRTKNNVSVSRNPWEWLNAGRC